MAGSISYPEIESLGAPLDWKDGPESPASRSKRVRVAVACRRCKGRKQKCDGCRPSCDKCQAAKTACEYAVTSKTAAWNRRQYVKALEKRVAQFQTALSNKELSDLGQDRWQGPNEDETTDCSASSSLYDGQYLPVMLSEEELDSFKESDLTNLPQLEEPESGGDKLAMAMRDLSLQANGGYVGPSAYLALGRAVAGIVNAIDSSPLESFSKQRSSNLCRLLSQPVAEGRSTETPWVPEFDVASLDPDIAGRLLHGYLGYIPSRWPILHRSHIMDLHSRRDRLETEYESFTLTLVYAIGGRYTNPVREDGEFFPTEFFQSALRRLEVIIALNDIRSVVCLLLLSIFSVKGPAGSSAWTYVGIAMRMCIAFGYHRATNNLTCRTFDVQMQRRVFWACYLLDRHISIATGRPFAISDQDIDTPLPADIDDSAGAVAFSDRATSRGPGRDSSMSCFIRQVKLAKIESRIQQSIYRVDRQTCMEDVEIDTFLAELAEWRAARPPETYKHSKFEYMAFGNDLTLVAYNKAIRLLLYPQLFLDQVNMKYINACANACSELLQIHQRRYTSTAYDLNLIALNSVYASGLTLIYCVWTSPPLLYSNNISTGVSACSIVLHVMAARWSGAQKYCDSFEFIRLSVLDFLSNQPAPMARQELPDADPRIRESLLSLAMDGNGQEQCFRMLDDIIGSPSLADFGMAEISGMAQ